MSWILYIIFVILYFVTIYLAYRSGKHSVKQEINGDTSDGYHTFNELYQYRMLYNAALINLIYLYKFDNIRCYKSCRHSDNKLCFDGRWFIVVMETPFGQISNHYENKYWSLFNCEELDKALEWDGHTPKQAAQRLELLSNFISSKIDDLYKVEKYYGN